MKQIVLNIKEGKYSFFIELIKSLDFVHVQDNTDVSKEEVKADIREAVEELKLVRQGKLKARNAEDLINEL